VLEITCCHFAGRQPFCLEERLINLSAVPEAADENFEELSPGAWLMSRVPWTAAEHRIRATEAGATAAAFLKVAAGKACMVVERRTWSADHTVTFVRLTYPGNLHELVARFAPPRAARIETMRATVITGARDSAAPDTARPAKIVAGKR
jgi:GntR family histidine utilization transcriptional repressor